MSEAHIESGTRNSGVAPDRDPAQQRRLVVARWERKLREQGRWFSIGRLAGMAEEADTLIKPPCDEMWTQEFWKAVTLGFFGRGRRCRVLLLHTDRPPGRLTGRAAKGADWRESSLRYAFACWIEIQPANDWLQSWLSPPVFYDWRAHPPVDAALKAAGHALVKRMPVGPSASIAGAPAGVVIDPLESEVRHWFSGVVADYLNRGERVTKEQAFRLASEKFPKITKHAFSVRIYKPPIVPKEWTRHGRPKGSRNKKGR